MEEPNKILILARMREYESSGNTEGIESGNPSLDPARFIQAEFHQTPKTSVTVISRL